MKAYWGVEVQLHAFFDLGTRWMILTMLHVFPISFSIDHLRDKWWQRNFIKLRTARVIPGLAAFKVIDRPQSEFRLEYGNLCAFIAVIHHTNFITFLFWFKHLQLKVEPTTRICEKMLLKMSNSRKMRGCIQKFPHWVDNEIYNKHLLWSNTKGYGGKTH
jgi:hypothetical protein